jgi:hypothetical protein
MIPALVNGKLSREQENLEDLLTSMVFGPLRYLDYESGLYRFLKHVDDDEFVRQLPSPGEAVEVRYDFWPWLTASECVGCEPDVLLTLGSDGSDQVRVLVEAKHRSEKSSFADPGNPLVTDQLAKEWVCLVKYCSLYGGKPLLLYLTSHHGRPVDDFEDAAKELSLKCPEFAREHPMQCGWLSWRHIGKAFARSVGVVQEDLVALADRMDFRFFEGIRLIRPTAAALWRFSHVFRFAECAQRMRLSNSSGEPSKKWRFNS